MIAFGDLILYPFKTAVDGWIEAIGMTGSWEVSFCGELLEIWISLIFSSFDLSEIAAGGYGG